MDRAKDADDLWTEYGAGGPPPLDYPNDNVDAPRPGEPQPKVALP